jgi:hypothetical protein
MGSILQKKVEAMGDQKTDGFSYFFGIVDRFVHNIPPKTREAR